MIERAVLNMRACSVFFNLLRLYISYKWLSLGLVFLTCCMEIAFQFLN